MIAFTGCDGAGKSTQVTCLAQALRENGYRTEILNKWDILSRERFPECRFLGADLDDLRVCIAEMEGPGRALFLFWSIAITMSKRDLRDPDVIYLTDGYWMKVAAAEIEYGCDPEWIDTIVACLPKADVTFYLDVSPEEALRRKPALTPYECGRRHDLSPRAFVAHQENMRGRLLGWARTHGWIVVSSMHDVADVAAELRGQVARALAAHGSEATRKATREKSEGTA